MALCGMEGANLKTDTIKILKIHFSYNRSYENNENYRNHIMEIKKILIFKTLAIPKMVPLLLIKDVSSSTITQFFNQKKL